MTRSLTILGWLFVAIDLVLAATMMLRRDVGDAATRGLGVGLGTVLAALGVVAALLLLAGRESNHAWLAVLGSVLAVAPIALGAVLTTSRQSLALLYPSMRDKGGPRQASPQYAFPDAAGRAAALALVMNDYAKLATLLRASPAPDLAAHDELGQSLLGIATRVALMDGGSMRDVEGLRLLVAAGAHARNDDLGHQPDANGQGQTLIELAAGVSAERTGVDRTRAVLGLLFDAGLSPDAPMGDGRSALFHDRLGTETARVLLARGANKSVHDTRGDARDWSAVTYQADLRNWATALVLLEAGVPRDFGSPEGSVLERGLRNVTATLTDEGRAEPAYAAFVAAVKR